MNNACYQITGKIAFWIFLSFVIALPLVGPERNVLLRQALAPALLMRLMALVLLLLSIAVVLLRKQLLFKTSPFLLVFTGYISVQIFANLQDGFSHIALFGDNKAAFRSVLFSVCLFIIVVAAYNVVSRKQLDQFARGIAASVGLVSFLGILQHLGLSPFLFQSERVYSTMINPLELAGFQVLVLPILVTGALYLNEEIEQKKATLFWIIWYPISIILTATCLFLTSSRSAILAALITLIILLFGYSRKQVFKLAPIGAAILIICAAITLVPIKPLSTAKGFAQPEDVLEIMSPSTQSRLATWRIGLKMFSSKPILGWGSAELANHFRAQEDLRFTREAGSDFNPFDMHSRLLNILVVNGIIGLILFLIIIGQLFYSERFLLLPWGRKPENDDNYIIEGCRKGLVFGILALLIHWQVAPSWVVTEAFFWIFIAIVFGTSEGKQKQIEFGFGEINNRIVGTSTAVFAVIVVFVIARATYIAGTALQAECLATAGIELASKGDYDEGIKYCRKATDLNPYEAGYYGRSGYILSAWGESEKSEKLLEESLSLYKEAISMNTGDPFRYERIVGVYQRLSNLNRSKWENELIEWAEIAEGKNPSSIHIKNVLREAHISVGEKEKTKRLEEELEQNK